MKTNPPGDSCLLDLTIEGEALGIEIKQALSGRILYIKVDGVTTVKVSQVPTLVRIAVDGSDVLHHI